MKHHQLIVAIALASCATAPASLTKASAIASAQASAKVGDSQSEALASLQRVGFRCRRLQPHEYASFHREPIKLINCYTSADRTTHGYTLVYANMTINTQGLLVEMHADSYPVVFRTLRKDAQGRIVVVQEKPLMQHPLPTTPEVRPVTANESIQGRWTINAVNGRQGNRLWIEFGGEGLGTVTRRADGGLNVGSPQPRTRAYLGCNYWHPNGWARNGDKLTFGIEMSTRTEMGCDVATTALDDSAYAILRKTMTMEFSPPNRMRLINENGTLDLVRYGN